MRNRYDCKYCSKPIEERTLDDCQCDINKLQRDWDYVKRMDLSSETKATVLADIQGKFANLKNEMIEIINSLELEK